MLKISCAEMKAMDAYAINEIGIPSIVLMENAALKVIQNIDLHTTHSFTIICAPGNNGGDGLAIARHLLLKDKKVDLFIVGDLKTATTDFQVNLKILKNMKTTFTHLIDTAGNGDVLGVSILANQTICFHLLKKGLVDKELYTGKITIVDIGIPKSVTQTILTQ